MPDGALPVLDVRDLKTVFRTRAGEVHAVNSVSFDLKPGELLGVVGESGSGKSVTMMSLIGLLPMPPAEIRDGTVLFDGEDLLQVSAERLRAIRGAGIGFVFQDPMTSLNPVFTDRLPDHGAAAQAHGPGQGRRPAPGRSNCWTWSTSPTPSAGWATTRTSFPAACGSG